METTSFVRANVRLMIEQLNQQLQDKQTNDKQQKQLPTSVNREANKSKKSASHIMRLKSVASLRQINVVGQLNHSASAGFLLILHLSALCLLSSSTDAVSWPFARSSSSLASLLAEPAKDPKQQQTSVKNAPSELLEAGKRSQMAPPAQHFHYFWNHDQIEPRQVEQEAGKILAEAQAQLDHASEAGNKQSVSSRQDPVATMSSSQVQTMASPEQSIVVPQAVQQQLTALVLQMQQQHQQQMSMAMQPRFAARNLIGAPSAPIMMPMNPMSRYWSAAASSHQPVIAAPPSLMSPAMLMPAESMQMNSPYQLMPAKPTGSGHLPGVPIYGPFSVAPSMRAAMPFLPNMFAAANNNHNHKTVAHNQQPSGGGKSFGSSLLSRRKSWPLFGLSGASQASSNSLLASASQSRPVVAPPPLNQPPRVVSAPDAAALLDLASSQLVNAIASEMQLKATQQKLASVIDQVMDQRARQVEQMQTLPSMSMAQQTNAKSADKQQHLQAPYLMAANKPFLFDPMQMAKLMPAELSVETNASSAAFGSRLKRRHLNQAGQKKSLDLKSDSGAIFEDLNEVQTKPRRESVTRKTNQSLAMSNSTSHDQFAKRPQQQSSGQRIVKKDSADPAKLKSADLSSADRKAEQKSLRHLFLMLATESPEPKSVAESSSYWQDLDRPNQLRRLKRSAQLIEDANKFKPSSATWSAVSAASKPTEAATGEGFLAEPMRLTSASWLPSSSSAWIPKGEDADTVRLPFSSSKMLKRKAELAEKPTSSPKVAASVESKSVAEPKLGEIDSAKSWSDGKALKVKQISASVSVMHHPSSRLTGDSAATSSRRGQIISGSPVKLVVSSTAKPLTREARQDSSAAADPMSSYLSESARVVNYFQNVEPEKVENNQQDANQQYSPSVAAPQSSNHQINVGFSAPKSTPNRQVMSDNNNNNYSELSKQSSSGNLASSGDFSAAANSNQKSTSSQNNRNQLLQVAANNEEQSLAVSHDNYQRRPTGSSALLGANSRPDQQAGGQSSQSDPHRPSSAPVFGASSQTRQSVVAPSGIRASSLQTSADQSNNYSEELAIPASNQNQFNMIADLLSQSSPNQQVSDANLQSEVQNSELSSSSFGQSFANQDKSFGSTSADVNSDQNLELSRMNQQQQQQVASQTQQILGSQSAQSDSLTPDGVDLFAPPLKQSDSSFETQLGSQSVNPSTGNQQQLYSKQMQALGAAVHSYNQQQLTNQLREAAFRSLDPQTRALLAQTISADSNYQRQLSPPPISLDEDSGNSLNNLAGSASNFATTAQLLALASQSPLSELGSQLLMSARPEHRDQEEEPMKEPKMAAKKGGKQVANHYHFNSFGSPYDELESPMNPLELMSSLNAAEAMKAQKAKANKDKEQDGDAEKPKKKSNFLRRFSLKNLFKRLKKDKKKGNESQDSESPESSD